MRQQSNVGDCHFLATNSVIRSEWTANAVAALLSNTCSEEGIKQWRTRSIRAAATGWREHLKGVYQLHPVALGICLLVGLIHALLKRETLEFNFLQSTWCVLYNQC